MSFLPDPKELKFGVGGLRQQYDKMKRWGDVLMIALKNICATFAGASTRRNEKTDLGDNARKYFMTHSILN